MKALIHVLLAASCLFWASAAGAAEERSAAKEIFDAAQKLFATKNYRAAALAFESAADKEPHGGACYAAGVSWQEAGELARAADNLTRALRLTGLDAEMERDARKRLQKLHGEVGRIHVIAPRGTRVSVAHVQNASPPVDLHAAPGDHGVNVAWPNGYASSHPVRVNAGKRVELYLTNADAPRGWGSDTPGQKTADGDGNALRTWGVIGIGSGAALGTIGAVLLANGIAARDEFDESAHTDADARDRAVSLRTWGNVALLSGVALAAGGVTLVLISSSSAQREATLRVAPGSVELGARF